MAQTTRRGFLTAGVTLCAMAAGLRRAVADVAGHSARAATELDTVEIRATAVASGDGAGTIFDEGTALSQVLVENLGATCWLRGRTTLTEEGREPVLSEYRPPEGGDWWRAEDGWTYLVQPLEDGGSVAWSEEVYEPLDWRGGEERELTATAEFQAVQADHVAQDLGADAPWGDIVPEACVHSRLAAAEEVGDGDED